MNPTFLLFLKALSLVFIFEGIMPVVAPQRWRKLMQKLLSREDRSLQFFGISSMLFGCVVLVLLHIFF